MTQKPKHKTKDQYHHGNLREALIDTSIAIIQKDGIEGLSLRKLAEQLGVSRMAPYHHFKDKNALLAAVALHGFEHLTTLLTKVFDDQLPIQEQLRHAVKQYLQFAVDHSTQYDLMFGRKLWGNPEMDDFQRQAKDCFRLYVRLFEQLKDSGHLSHEDEPLRLAQLLWATMHGLAKLTEEGLFSIGGALDDITDYALSRLQPLLEN